MQRFFTLLITWLLVLAGQVQAESQPSYLVAVNDADFHPFSWIDRGQFRGADREVLDAFARDQQVTLSYLPLPRLRALELLRAGEVDLIYPDDRYWTFGIKKQLGLELAYSDHAVTNQTGFFLLQRRECTAELRSIGTLLGWMADGYREKIERGEVELKRFATLDQMLDAGLKGSVDALFSERQFLESYIERHPIYSELEFCEALPSSIGHFRLSTLNKPEVLEAFNRFVRQRPEVINEIRERYRLP